MPNYDPYLTAYALGLIGAWDAATCHNILTDGQTINISLPDLSGNGNHITPSALAATGLPTYKEADPLTGTGRGPSYAPRIHMASKNCLVTPTGVRDAIGSGDCTVLLIAVEPVAMANQNFSLFGFCNGNAYRTGTGTINTTGSIGVTAVYESGFFWLKRAGVKIGDLSIAPNASNPLTANQICRYIATIAKRVAGIWYVSRGGLPFQPAYANSTDPVPANPLLDLSFGYSGGNNASQDFLYGSIYNRGLSDAEVNSIVLGYSLQKLDCQGIAVLGNSIPAGFGLQPEDKPLTLIGNVYNEASTDKKASFVFADTIVGRTYQSMSQHYQNTQNPNGNAFSPIRGNIIALIHEEINTLVQAPAGQDPVLWVHTKRETFLSQFYALPLIEIHVCSCLPFLGVSDTLRQLLHADLVSHLQALEALYPGQFHLIDCGMDPDIGVEGAQMGPLFLPDHKHLSGTDTGGERILINDYYLLTLANWSS